MQSTNTATENKSTIFNSFCVRGNLVSDLRIDEIHPNIASFRIASNDAQNHVSYFTIAFNGENRINENKDKLVKGAFVKVSGALREDRWEDKTTGAARSKLVLSATKVEFLTKREK